MISLTLTDQDYTRAFQSLFAIYKGDTDMTAKIRKMYGRWHYDCLTPADEQMLLQEYLNYCDWCDCQYD